MKKTTHGFMGNGHFHCTNPHQDQHSMNHDIHSLLHPTHAAFEELLQEKIKEKLSSNSKVTEQIDKLASLGVTFVESHIKESADDISTSFEENKEDHS